MAQLPPKIPNMTPTSWREFSQHHHQQQRTTTTTMMPFPAARGGGRSSNNPSWVDEFLDFSAAKRNAHRRSVSDSVDPAVLDECRKADAGAGDGNNGNGSEFERFDDEQFLSMFSDAAAAVVSPPSDHNSFNEEKQTSSDQKKKQGNETEEVQSQCGGEEQQDHHIHGCATTKIVDPKRVKRILANRQSAQRSRVRKLQYISELERSVTSLQAEVSALSPRVAFLDHQRLLLNVDNSALKQRIAALQQDKIFKEAHQEALKREIERLRQVYQQQNSLKNAENPTEPPPPQPQPSDQANHKAHNESTAQLLNV